MPAGYGCAVVRFTQEVELGRGLRLSRVAWSRGKRLSAARTSTEGRAEVDSDDPNALINPIVLVEVLSPTPEDTRRLPKTPTGVRSSSTTSRSNRCRRLRSLPTIGGPSRSSRGLGSVGRPSKWTTTVT